MSGMQAIDLSARHVGQRVSISWTADGEPMQVGGQLEGLEVLTDSDSVLCEARPRVYATTVLVQVDGHSLYLRGNEQVQVLPPSPQPVRVTE